MSLNDVTGCIFAICIFNPVVDRQIQCIALLHPQMRVHMKLKGNCTAIGVYCPELGYQKISELVSFDKPHCQKTCLRGSNQV